MGRLQAEHATATGKTLLSERRLNKDTNAIAINQSSGITLLSRADSNGHIFKNSNPWSEKKNPWEESR